MKELKVIAWCDHEDHEPDEHDPVAPQEPATNTFKVSVDDGRPYEIDLCDDHALPFIEVFTVLEERGTTVTGKTKKKVKTPRLKVDGTPAKGGGRQPENLPNPPCPDCGQGPYTSRSALGSHSREQHGKALIDLLPFEQLSITDQIRVQKKAAAAAEQEAETQAS